VTPFECLRHQFVCLGHPFVGLRHPFVTEGRGARR
jgi:hypothetical protein